MNYVWSFRRKSPPRAQEEKSNVDVSEIQEKLEFVMKQMEAVQEDNRKKTQELEHLKSQLNAPAPSAQPVKSKPVPPPFPPELERYSQKSERFPEQMHHTIASPVHSPQVDQSEDTREARSPALPYLCEIREAASKRRLKKVEINEKKPVTHKPTVNDEIRERLRQRIRMMEDSEPEEEVHWRESDIF